MCILSRAFPSDPLALAQDSDVIGLLAKNAPLTPYQPVVTTVLYEKPSADSAKEVVLWKPALNWDHDTPTFFRAARGIETCHGMAHIQRAGLQLGTKHGVFHSSAEEHGVRTGWRVALSARITRPDAVERVEGHRAAGKYSQELGPDGDWSLRRDSE